MARMSNLMQGLMGAGIALIVFAVGFGVGRTTAESRSEEAVSRLAYKWSFLNG